MKTTLAMFRLLPIAALLAACGQGVVEPPPSSDNGTTSSALDAQTCSGLKASLFLDGDSTDYIHPGASIYTDGIWTVSTAAPDDVSIFFHTSDYSEWWSVEVSTQELGKSLAVGTYTNAQRAPFAQPGHPGLEVYGDGRGCNTLTGSFQVDAISFDSNGLVQLNASFIQHCEGQSPKLLGMIAYHR